jgi:hypothetical protein
MRSFATVGCYVLGHAWKDWTYDFQGSCEQARVCRRCQTREGRVQHQIEQNNGVLQLGAACSRCGVSVVSCEVCDGTGRQSCQNCHGSGRDETYSGEPIGWNMNKYMQTGHGYLYHDGSCRVCGGEGRAGNCATCNGAGTLLRHLA